MLHYQLGLNSFVFGLTSITIMFPLSSKKDSKVFFFIAISLFQIGLYSIVFCWTGIYISIIFYFPLALGNSIKDPGITRTVIGFLVLLLYENT